MQVWVWKPLHGILTLLPLWQFLNAFFFLGNILCNLYNQALIMFWCNFIHIEITRCPIGLEKKAVVNKLPINWNFQLKIFLAIIYYLRKHKKKIMNKLNLNIFIMLFWLQFLPLRLIILCNAEGHLSSICVKEDLF